MIKFIHQNKQFIGVVFFIIAVCFAISGVGLDILHGDVSPTRDALTINGEKLSWRDVERAERSIESRYRQMFGEQYSQIAASLNMNIRQQAVDSLIDKAILDQEAAREGLVTSDEEVRKYLLTQVFKGQQFSLATYRNMLQSVGMTAPQFENEIKGELARTTLANLIRDTAVTTQKDIEGLLKRNKTKYIVTAATVSSANLAGSLPTPSEADLKRFYDSHATEYERPAQVSYSYTVFSPRDFEKDVEVTPQDVEFFYSENISKFSLPEEARVRSIKLLYPKQADPTLMAAVREKATAAHNEALSGQPFEAIVAKYSDDLPTRFSGGNLGWIKRGEKAPEIDKAIANTTPGQVSEIVSLDYGFEILKVEEKKAARPRPLEEVRVAIEKEIRSQEAPAYASNKAREVRAMALKGGKSITDLLPSGLEVKVTGKLLEQNQDPEAVLSGLTQNVFMLPTSERLKPALIELENITALVQIQEFKEPTTPPFEEVKGKVLIAFTSEEAKRAAFTRADDLLKAALASPNTFANDSKVRSAKIVGPLELSRENPASDKFPSMTPQMRNAILTAKVPGSVLGMVFANRDEFTVIKIDEIKVPVLTDPAISSELPKYRSQANQELAQNMFSSSLNVLKSRSRIETDPEILRE